MKSTTKDKADRENIDLFGCQYHLASRGRRIINDSSDQLFHIQAELRGLSVLFRGYSESEGNEDFYGLSVSLARLSRRLMRISDRLSTSITDEKSDANQTIVPQANGTG